MDKDKIEMKATMENAAVADYLTALAKGFKTGIITVEKDGESLTLMPVETAEVEVEARVKKDKARFSLEVTWRLAQEQDDAASFSISAEAPKAVSSKSETSAKPEQKCEKKDEKKEDKKDDKKDMKKVEAPAAHAAAHAPAVKPAAPVGAAHVTVSVVKPAAPAAGDPKAGLKS